MSHIDLDIEECALGIDQCHSAATCSNTRGSYQCTCPAGSAGDGYNCTGIWILRIVYVSDGLGIMIDLCNECTGVPSNCGNHNCNVTVSDCTNTIGSFQCTCRFGLAMDGISCARMLME